MSIFEKIEPYRLAWLARMERGYFGPIAKKEESNIYGPCIIKNGKMVLNERRI